MAGAFAVLFVCCTPLLAPPSEKEVNTAKQKFGTASQEELSKGYHLYINKCGSCHVLYKPEKYTEEKWKMDMVEMSSRAHLNDEEQALVLKYVLTQREVNLANSTGSK